MGGIMMPYLGSMGQDGYVPPNVLPNLSLWYNGSAAYTTVNGASTADFDVSATLVNGSSIGSWLDLQGVGGPANYFNGGGGNKPTYTTGIQNGLGAVTYASASKQNLDINQNMSSWIQNKTAMTVFVLARPTSLPASIVPLTVTETSLGIWWNGTNWSVGSSATSYGTVTVTNDTTKFHIYGFVFDGSQSTAAAKLTFRYDKAVKSLTLTGSGDTTTGAPGYLFFGGDARSSGTFSAKFMSGYIGEVLIWTRALTASEINSVELYLNTKWNLGLA